LRALKKPVAKRLANALRARRSSRPEGFLRRRPRGDCRPGAGGMYQRKTALERGQRPSIFDFV